MVSNEIKKIKEMTYIKFIEKIKNVLFLVAEIITQVVYVIFFSIAIVIFFVIGILLYPVYLINQAIEVYKNE